MPRARWLKPDFFTDKKIANLSAETALVYEALWVWADDGGVCICDPDWLKAQAFFRWEIFTVDVISRAIRELFDIRVIYVYRVSDDYFASIRHWNRHQAVHKPSKFRHPRPEEQLTFASSTLPPESPGTVPGTLHASPPTRHLDTKTPRQLDGVGAAALSPENPGTVDPEPATATAPPKATTPFPEDAFKTGKTPGEVSLARELDTDSDRVNLTALCASVPAAFTWVAELRARLEGMHGPPMTPRQVGDALAEFVGSGQHLKSPPSFTQFKRFLDLTRDRQENVPRGTQAATASQNGVPRRPDDQPVSTGEAGAILVKIKAFSRRTETQGSGGVVFIRRTEVEELGAEVLAAYDTIGGADGVLKCDPSRWGLLVRDFANALTYQRQHKPEPAT